jgi:serine/threonine-protein kinase
MKHVNGHLVPPEEVNPEVPEGINAITVRLLAKKPEDRYADANELMRDLERVLDGLKPFAMSKTHVMNRVAPASPARTRVVPPPTQGKRKRRRWVPILLVLLLLTLLGGGAYAALAPLLSPRTVAVPNLAGNTIVEAREEVGEDFVIDEGSRVESEEPIGTIVEQDPNSGEEQNVSSVISVDISDGQGVPNVRGETRQEARETLEEAGFEVAEETETSSVVEDGYVIRQNPRGGPGETAEAGSTVTIMISDGPETVTVPDLYNLTPEGANNLLAEAGLKLGGQTQEASNTVAAGSIISQNPAAQSSVEPDSSVAVVVSSGPEEITVPDVAGQDWVTAAQRLRDAGLTVNEMVNTIPSSRPKNEVVSTDLQAGLQVAPGTLVTLTTSQGPPPPAPAPTQEPESNTQQPAPKQSAQPKSKGGDSKNKDDD